MSATSHHCDVLVVGGGHAGCEAALAAARSGMATVLLTMRSSDIACMPCNPSVGGIAKSHLVSELDALGGEIGRNADYTGIQFRMLNTRKGPAVRSNRVQCDKTFYSRRMRSVLIGQQNLEVRQGTCRELVVRSGAVEGVKLQDGRTLSATTVVLTPGTYLNGVIHIGEESWPGGRGDAPAATELGQALRRLGFAVARLKTGTPPRLHAASIDYGHMQEQPGNEPPPFFSWKARRDHEMFHVEQSAPDVRPWPPGSDQIPCYLTHTTPQTHSIIREGLSRSSLYGGRIEGTGVRYCPSVEDKIVKFAEKEAHHVFIEPEGRTTELVYPNGISNSLPRDIQEEMVYSIPGLENANILAWGYAIEYDFIDPTQLTAWLESKSIRNLFLSGQINGTTGYEEAAAQGFVAGINAVRRCRGEAPWTLRRNEAYIGVLIDDLVTKGTDEPYRMFTSRAEHRLLLRQDNARFRMLPHARDLGVASSDMLRDTEQTEHDIQTEIERLNCERSEGVTLAKLLARPEMTYDQLPGAREDLSAEVREQVQIQIKYSGYIAREQRQIADENTMDAVKIPEWLDYWSLETLRYESREKLSRIRPANLAQAARVPGVTPADLAVLSIAIKRGRADDQR